MNFRIAQKKWLLIFLLILSISSGKQRAAKETEVMGHTLYTVLKPGDIPAIFKPEFISVDQADSLYYSDEPLLVVTAGDEVKAYSTWHLDHHEVVNDFIDGTAIAATW